MTFSRKDTKVIKGLAIILMLYHHLFFFPDRIAEGIQYIPLFKIGGTSSAYFLGEFGKICVALFLFLGGYGTYISCSKSSENNIYITETISKKIRALYAEYWKVFVVFVPVCMLAGVNRVERNIESFLWNLSGLSISYCGEWWFFTPYIGLLVTFPIAFRVIHRKNDMYMDIVGIILYHVFVSYVLNRLYAYNWAQGLQYSTFWNVINSALVNGTPFYTGCIFAKHDLLTKWKRFFKKDRIHILLGCVVVLIVFYMRHKTGMMYDFVYAPALTAAAIAILEAFPIKAPYWILGKIGEESTTIWLVHSIYCYLLCQKLVFLPGYTILIFLWLMAMSYATSIVLKKGTNLVSRGIKKLA